MILSLYPLHILGTHLVYHRYREPYQFWGENIIIGCPVSTNSSLDYTCTLILDWKAFLEGQIISGMWTPRTQQKDQIDILEMKETCLLISNRTFSTGLTLATYNTTAVAYFKGLSLLFLGPLLKVQIAMSHRPWNWKKPTTSNYLWTMLRPMIEDLKNEKKRRLMPFQNELKLWALWLKFESAN